MEVAHKILMIISLPALIFGWFCAVFGIYYLGASIFNYSTTEENTSLAAIWAFVFSFGVISFASILAAKANYASNTDVRQVYKYSIVVSAILFLGYTLVGVVTALLDLTISA